MTVQTATYAEGAGARRKDTVAAVAKVGYLPSIFIVSVAIPYIIDIGTLRMSPNRFFLLFMLFPSLIAWLFGATGKKRLGDYCILLFTFWCSLAMIINDGFNESFQGIGMWVIETVGAYFFGRAFIRNSSQFLYMVKTLQRLMYVLLPFAILESVLRHPVLLEVLGKTGKVIESIYGDGENRLGMRRAQVSFEHPILFGVFSSYGFGLFTYCLEKKIVTFKSGIRGLISPANAFFSLSTGAYLSVIIQGLFAAWDYFTRTVKGRWKILAGILLFCYVTVDALSNRTPFEVFVSYAVFDSSTSYNRILIWEYGTAQVWRTPWFGVGLTGTWERPWWMVSSMDNFGLLLAVRYGIFAAAMMILTVLSNMRAIVTAPLKSQVLSNIRLGYVITMIGVIVASCTVHFWTATYVLFLFMLGAGVWLADAVAEDQDETQPELKGSPLETTVKRPLNFRPAVRPGSRTSGQNR